MWTKPESGNNKQSCVIHRLSGEKILLTSTDHKNFNVYYNQLSDRESATTFTKCLLRLIFTIQGEEGNQLYLDWAAFWKYLPLYRNMVIGTNTAIWAK